MSLGWWALCQLLQFNGASVLQRVLQCKLKRWHWWHMFESHSPRRLKNVVWDAKNAYPLRECLWHVRHFKNNRQLAQFPSTLNSEWFQDDKTLVFQKSAFPFIEGVCASNSNNCLPGLESVPVRCPWVRRSWPQGCIELAVSKCDNHSNIHMDFALVGIDSWYEVGSLLRPWHLKG